MKTIRTLSLILSILALQLTNGGFAQGEEKESYPGYVPPADSIFARYGTVASTGNGLASCTSISPIICTQDQGDIRLSPGSTHQQAEVHIKIDNNNPKNIIASFNTNIFSSAFGGYVDEQGYYYSYTGGGGSPPWQGGSDYYPHMTYITTGNTVSGDPSCAFDLNSNTFISTLEADPSNGPQGFYNVVSYFQNPGGPLFSTNPNGNAIYTPRVSSTSLELDKEMIAVDNFPYSVYANSIYAVATEFTSTVPDPAASGENCISTGNVSFFGSTVAHNTQGSSGNPINSITEADLRSLVATPVSGFGMGANVQTGPNGEVYVCWADYPGGNYPANNIGFAYYSPAGNTWSNATLAAFGANYMGGINFFCNDQLQTTLNTSPSGFPSVFGTPWNSGSNTGGYIRMNDYPSMAVDRSCPVAGSDTDPSISHYGRIYIAFPEIDNNASDNTYNNPAIGISWSDDNGATWHQPANPIISIQNLRNTTLKHDGSQLNGPICFLPWIAVDDATGIVSVAYYAFDGTNGVDQTYGGTNGVYNSTNTYVAYSADGGNTWGNQLVSDVPHFTAPIPGLQTYAGDYIGITSYGSKAFVAWADNSVRVAGTGSNPPHSGTTVADQPNSLWQIYVSELDYTLGGNPVPAYSAPVPTILDVNGAITIATGVSQTYEATQQVVIPYTNTFQNVSGSSVDIFACNEVNLRNGFSGSNDLHAYIYCVPKCSQINGREDGRLSASNGKGGTSDIAATPTNIIQKETKLGSYVKLGIFPNPTSGVVYLSLSAQNAGNLLVNLSDATGKQLMHNSYPAVEGTNSYKLDLSDLNSGAYFIHVTDENGVTIKNDKLMLMGQ